MRKKEAEVAAKVREFIENAIKHGSILKANEQALKGFDINKTSKVEVYLEREMAIAGTHNIMKRLGWILDWKIVLPNGLKCDDRLGRIIVDCRNFKSSISKLINGKLLIPETVTQSATDKVEIKGRKKIEIENALIKLGYAEMSVREGATYKKRYWKVGAESLRTNLIDLYKIAELIGMTSELGDSKPYVEQIMLSPSVTKTRKKSRRVELIPTPTPAPVLTEHIKIGRETSLEELLLEKVKTINQLIELKGR